MDTGTFIRLKTEWETILVGEVGEEGTGCSQAVRYPTHISP